MVSILELNILKAYWKYKISSKYVYKEYESLQSLR